MNWAAVSVITPATGLAVSVAEMRGSLYIRSTSQDSYIESLIRAATALIEGPNGIGSAMLAQTWRYTLDAFPSGVLALPGRGVTAVSSVNYVDENGNDRVMQAADWRADLSATPVRIEAVNAWPATDTRIGAVWIDYAIGGDVHEDLKNALRLIVAHWYMPEEMAGSADRSGIPYQAQHLIMRHHAQLVG